MATAPVRTTRSIDNHPSLALSFASRTFGPVSSALGGNSCESCKSAVFKKGIHPCPHAPCLALVGLAVVGSKPQRPGGAAFRLEPPAPRLLESRHRCGRPEQRLGG